MLVATISASFAFFTSNITSSGENKIDATTVVLASARMDYGEKVEAKGILPGNKIIKTIKVTGSGPEGAVPIKATIILSPNVIDFANHIKYKLYAVENSDIDASSICESPKPIVEDGKYYDAMECDTTSLGNPILEGTLERKKVVTKEIEVTRTTNTTYYLLIEYENDPNGQDEEQNKTFTINIGFQAEYEGPSITQSFIVNGEEVNDLPTKQEYYEVAVTCSDNIERSWNYETWSLEIEEDLESSCSCALEFNKNANKYLECLAKENPNELAYDGTIDNNLRYIGSSPNNYVLFNNELWRIIGIMNNIEDSDGNIGSHIKLIRNESIGNYYWSGSSSNRSNDWTKSTLNTEVLNGTYYNGLSTEAKNMISSIIWNLGGRADTNATSNTFYIAERGTSVYGSNPKTWTGKIGLMYPSDFGFAVGGSTRETCLNTNLGNYHNCYVNDWLYLSLQWLLTSEDKNAEYMFYLSNVGTIHSTIYNRNYAIKPTLYLNSNITLLSGTGSTTDPFILKVKE